MRIPWVALLALGAGACSSSSNANDLGAPPDLGSPASQQLAAVRAAADAAGGTLSLPVAGVLVTYVRDAFGAEPAGFFVQAEAAGPALFVAVDPTTLDPSPSPGDDVGFTVSAVAKASGVRQATAVADWTRVNSNNSLAALVRDVSAATDVASNLDAYESTLIHAEGTLAAALAARGTGFVAAPFATTGLGDGSLTLRLPDAANDELDLAKACTLALDGILWRDGASAEPSVWSANDVSITSCPAGAMLSASAPSKTTVVVSFERLLDASSVTADGSQFTFTGGLTASAATAAGRTVTLTTSAQTAAASYTVTVDESLTDVHGMGIDPAAASVTFAGSP